MRQFVFTAIGWLGLCAATAANPATPPAAAEKCALCHGERGESAAEDIPRLAGQHEEYLEKQLGDFKAGRRGGLMVRMARRLSGEEIAALARFYASQPAAPAAAATEMAPVGAFIHRRGNPWSGVPACRTCHGETGRGTAKLPRLAGQDAAYLERQIREFTQRSRTNDNEVMHVIAERLTPLETRAVAQYLAALP